MTLLVIPAPRLHPFTGPLAGAGDWLLDRARRRRRRSPSTGCSTGARARRRCPPARCGAGRAATPPSSRASTPSATVAGVEAGRRILAARRPAAARLRRARLRLHRRAARAPRRRASTGGRRCSRLRGRAPRRARPRSCLGTSSALKRAASPALVRAGAALSGRLLRLDLHPADFDHPRHVLALEHVLQRARERDRGHLRRPLLKRVLRANWREGVRRDGTPFAFTCPSPRRYKHQWYWDSCFHAIAWTHIDPARAREELRTLLRAGRADGFVPHTAFWQASPRWRRAPLYATAGYRGDTATQSIQTPLLAVAWERVGDGDPAFVAEGLAPLRRARALADPRARPGRRRAADDPAARRVRPRRLAEVRRGLRAAGALAAGLRAARAALPARRLGRAHARRAPPTSTSRTCWSTSPTRCRCARSRGCRASAEWAARADAHGDGAARALLGRAARAVLRSRRPRRAPRRGLDLVVAGAARARRRDPARRSASGSSTSTCCTRAATRARFGVPSRVDGGADVPAGLQRLPHVARRGLDQHRVAAGRRPARCSAPGRGRRARRAASPTPIERSGFREYYHPRTGTGHGEHRFGWSTLLLDLPAGFSPPRRG